MQKHIHRPVNWWMSAVIACISTVPAPVVPPWCSRLDWVIGQHPGEDMYNPKWRRRHESAPMIEPAWDGAKQVHFQAMQRNSPKICTRCCKTPTFRDPTSWLDIHSEVLSYVYSPTT